jgi:BlaI family penicillinase repressor
VGLSKGENNTLTKLELQLMQVIWRQGASSVGEVQQGLELARGEDAPVLAYTTVQTMLNILERKGKLRRTLRGRAYVYAATVTEERASGHAVRDLVDRMFGGSSEELVMSLIKSRQIDAEKIAALGRKVEAAERKGKADESR